MRLRVATLRRKNPEAATARVRREERERASAGANRGPKSSFAKRRAQQNTYGRDLEARAIAAFSEGDFPHWYLRIRPGTYTEDHEGIDLWVDTDVGPIAVQVKSSAARAILFREKHPLGGIAVVVLHGRMSDAEIRGIVLRHVAAERIGRSRRR